MKVLLVKITSLGDLINTFPALCDAAKYAPHVQFDWLVDEAFQNVPTWHQNVKNVITLSLRAWCKSWYRLKNLQSLWRTLKKVRAKRYDLIIDAQGLLKSVFWTKIARGKSVGYNWNSAREP